jgi:hypothetical protein
MALIVRENEGPGFAHLFPQQDNDDHECDVLVEFGRNEWSASITFNQGGGGRNNNNANRQIDSIAIFPYYLMSANAGRRYSALLASLATNQYRHVRLQWSAQPGLPPPPPPSSPPGTMGVMEDILTAMRVNQQPVPAQFGIRGMRLTMPILHRALQLPRTALIECRMESPLEPMVLPDDATNHDDSPERGSNLHLGPGNGWLGILQTATTLQTNVTSLMLDFNNPIDGRLDLSGLIGSFVAAQPYRMDLTIYFQSNPRDGDGIVIVERILADVATQCPSVHSLFLRVRDDALPLFTRVQHLPRLSQLLSDSSLTRFELRELRDLQARVLSQEQEQRMAVITQRNTVIPMYLGTTNLLKPRRPPVVNPIDPPPIVVYADDGEDRRKHQFVLSHALSQAAVHPIFFTHFYQFVLNHADQLPGGEKGRRQQQQQPPDNIRREHGA